MIDLNQFYRIVFDAVGIFLYVAQIGSQKKHELSYQNEIIHKWTTTVSFSKGRRADSRKVVWQMKQTENYVTHYATHC